MQTLRRAGTLLLLLTMLVAGTVCAQQTVTYTVEDKSTVTASGTVPDGSSATFASTYATTPQITKDNSQTLTLSGFSGLKVTKIKLSMHSNTKNGSGKLSYSNDGGKTFTYLVGSASEGATFKNDNWHGSYSSDFVDIEKTVDIECSTSKLVIKIEATVSSLYCQSYTLTYTDGTPHTVTFDAGTGTCTTTSITETAGGAGVTLPAATPIEDWTLHGWSTASVAATTAAPSTMVGTAGDTYFPASDHTLYAVYKQADEPSLHTVSLTKTEIAAAKTAHGYGGGYVENAVIESASGIWGGSCLVNSTYLQINNKNGYHIASPVFGGTVRKGHIYTTSNGSSGTASDRKFLICSSNDNDEPTGGDLGEGQLSETSGDVEITLSGNPSRFYIYTDNGAAYIKQIDVEYYGSMAVYDSNPVAGESGHTVTFDAGSGYCETESLKELMSGMGVILPAASIAIAGYDTFAGWATAPAEGASALPPTIVGAAGDNYKPDGDVTLYAVYRKGEGGSGEEPFAKITSTDDVNTDDEYLLVAESVSRAPTTVATTGEKAKKWQMAAVTIAGGKIASEGGATPIKFGLDDEGRYSIEMLTTEDEKFVAMTGKMSTDYLHAFTTAQYTWKTEAYNGGVILVETGRDRHLGLQIDSYDGDYYLKDYAESSRTANPPAVLYKRKAAIYTYTYDTYVRATVTTNSDGYASFAPSYHLLMPADADLLYIIGADGNKIVTMSANDEVGDKTLTKATGVIVSTEEGGTTVSLVYRDERRTDRIVALDGNLLEGVTDSLTYDDAFLKTVYYYYLKGTGFKRWKTGTLAPNKCYLNLTPEQASNIASFVFSFDGGTTTAVSMPAAETADTPAYDLTGRRTSASHRGITIRNGKKIIR